MSSITPDMAFILSMPPCKILPGLTQSCIIYQPPDRWYMREVFFGLSRPVNDSFGIVVLNKEVPGAAVLNNGQEIGKTGSFGTMVVPTLTSYGQNKITLDTKNIPMITAYPT